MKVFDTVRNEYTEDNRLEIGPGIVKCSDGDTIASAQASFHLGDGINVMLSLIDNADTDVIKLVNRCAMLLIRLGIDEEAISIGFDYSSKNAKKKEG